MFNKMIEAMNVWPSLYLNLITGIGHKLAVLYLIIQGDKLHPEQLFYLPNSVEITFTLIPMVRCF